MRRFFFGACPRGGANTAYTLARKDLGRDHAPALHGRAQTLAACAIGALILKTGCDAFLR